MKSLKAFALIVIVISSIDTFAMKPREIQDILQEAFTNFSLTDSVLAITTPKESTALWDYQDGQCDLTRDATTDKDLCAFAAHWLAASIKNGTVARVRTAFNAGAAGTFALLIPGLFIAQDNSLRVYAALTALGLTFVNAPAKVAQWMRSRCDRESFCLASATLFEKEKYAALLSYFTHLQLHDHTPLSYDEKSLLLQKVVSNNNAQFNYIVCRNTSLKTISTSLKKDRKELTVNITRKLSEKEVKNYEAGYFPLSLNSAKI